MSCRRIPGEYGAEAGRIHEAHPTRQQRTWHKHFYAPNSFCVLWIAFFRHVLVEIRYADFLPRTISHLYSRLSFVSEPDYGGNCGHRNEANRKNRITNQSIDQRGLATLELPNASNI